MSNKDRSHPETTSDSTMRREQRSKQQSSGDESPKSSSSRSLPNGISRRRFLQVSALSAVTAALNTRCTGEDDSSPSADGTDAAAQQTGSNSEDVLMHFTDAQAAIVRAAAARIIPTDENGPGATEAGVVYFIDHQLAQVPDLRGKVYQLGPFAEGLPTQGDQSQLSLRERYRIGLVAMDSYAQQTFGTDFPSLTEEQQDQILYDMQVGNADAGLEAEAIQNVPVQFSGMGPETVQHASPSGLVFGLQAFFEILRAHTISGFFSDPMHGGNRDMVGWRLIGFPGAQIGGYRDWIQNYGVPFPDEPTSLAEYQAAGALHSSDDNGQDGGS